MNTVEHYLAEQQRVADALPGSGDGWLNQIRASALERFRATEFPTTRVEEWKYTDVRKIRKQAFHLPESDAGVSRADIDALLPERLEAHRLVFVNGHFQSALSDIGSLPEGARITGMAQALTEPDDVLRTHLGQVIGEQTSGFSELNAALLNDGLYLSLANDVVLEKPVHVLFLGTQSAQPALSNVHNLYHLGSGAQASVIEHYAGTADAEYFTNAVSEVVTESNASLRYYKLQEESENATHVASVHVRQARDSRFASHSADFGGRLVRTDINSVFAGEGADARLYGLYLTSGKQHVDNHTRVDHINAHGTSREFYKGILDDSSRGVFNGMVYVSQQGQQTDSQQKTDALLLSKRAEVDAKPELEIYADDVQCQHGSTVGQLDEQAIFYLQSRGIDLSGARSLLTYSFAEDIIREFRLQPLRSHVEKALLQHLPDGDQIREML